MSLGREADFIATDGPFIVECLDDGWWNAYCSKCGAKASSMEHEFVQSWMDIHKEECDE